MAAEPQFADLVFEGGGVKGIGLAGAYAGLRERGFTPKRVAGTSAGAITAALVAARYESEELDRILLSLPFARFKDEGRLDRLPLGKLASLLFERGIYEGDFLETWMAERLAEKGISTFAQLADSEAESLAARYRLKVIASDLTHRRMLVLPDDAGHLGLEPDELGVARAVRMSMSIPIFFEPVVHENPRTGEQHLIVDGGLLSNFPVWIFDRKGGEPPRWPTFGLLLVEPEPRRPLGHRLPEAGHGAAQGSLLDFLKSLAATAMEAHDRMYVEQATYARTIAIPTLGVGTTEFDITPARRDALYAAGHTAALEFLDTWDFDAYVAEFRSGKDHSRRDALVEKLRE